MPSFAGQIDGLVTVSLADAVSVSANTNLAMTDIRDYIGKARVVVQGGDMTAGDNNSTITVYVQDSADSNVQNATNANITVGTLSNVASTLTSDIDTRSLKRYVRLQMDVAGGNSPAAPVAASLSGFKEVD